MLAVLFHPSSYLGIVVFLILTGCGLPIPEELAFVVAGVLSAEGRLHWPTAWAACLVGAILGDSVMYWIGRRWGDWLLSAHPRFAWMLQAKREKQFEEAVEQHAFKVMFLSRFLVGIRGPVYVAAGAVHVPYRRFLLDRHGVCDDRRFAVLLALVFLRRAGARLDPRRGDHGHDWRGLGRDGDWPVLVPAEPAEDYGDCDERREQGARGRRRGEQLRPTVRVDG